MKAFCIGRNYVDHAKELNNAVPSQPMVFSKYNTALVYDDKPFFYPEFSKNVHYEGELVIKMCKNGKNIQEEFAHTYFDEITVGIDYTARDIQAKCKEKGHPWEIAKSFNGSGPVGRFIPISSLKDKANIHFELHKNREPVQIGYSKDMIFPFSTLIAHISKYFLIGKGDIIFTGTPAGVGPVKIGDKLEGYIEGNQLIRSDVR